MDEEDTCHYDFTTASELEIFISRLEEIVLEWGLHQKCVEEPLQEKDFLTKEWCSWSESITFSEAEFLLVRYFLKCDKISEDQYETETSEDMEEVPGQAVQDMMSNANDFFPITNPPSKNSHPIARWYGLRDFVVLIPQHSSYVASESRVKILLSAISIAVNNTRCKVPFFLLALEPWQCYFLGVYKCGSFLTEFSMVHLKQVPSRCKFLTGLLNMFKSKIGLGMFYSPVTVTVRFTYLLKDWPNPVCTQEPPDLDFHEVDVARLSNLPFGSVYDSISELYLSALWPSLSENSVVDGENYSDLDPLQAPIWRVFVTTVDNPACLLADYYTEFVVLTRGKHSIRELLGNLISSSSANAKHADLSSSLNVLTESKISALSKAVIGNERNAKREAARQSQQSEGPISPENLMVILYYLFPDADVNSTSPYCENFGEKFSGDVETQKRSETFDRKLGGMKSAPLDGLLWRLSIAMAYVIHSLGGVRSAAYLWYEFTQELRFRWENGILIPGLQSGFPDSKTCLLNQKLQLLNCCIKKRIEREASSKRKSVEDESESDSDEIFYDCGEDEGGRKEKEGEGEEEEEEEEEEGRGMRGRGRGRAKHAPWNKPVGRLTRHGDMKLLETGEPMYIPATQEIVPKTEDQLEEDAEVLLRLGADAQGSELRARLMSASLLSDMEAFKAANPGCILPDFIRWYSPRDWIEDEDEGGGGGGEDARRKGHLSKRMEIPGNTWLEVWQVAQPVPAKWQRRLFNDTGEAEKVLNFLERKTPKEFIELLLPVIIVCVIRKLLEESSAEELPGVKEILSKLIKKAEVLGRMPKIEGSRYEELINEVSAVETLLVHSNCLRNKFIRALDEDGKEKKTETQPDLVKFINSLLTGVETEVPGGPKSKIGATIRSYFAEAAKVEQLILDNQWSNEKWNVMSPFPSPHEKEMILRLSTSKGPQRLHAVLKKNEYRICGAFTKNIYFPM